MNNSVYFGGSPPVIGGMKDLLEYATSRSMKNKEQLIRNIATDLKRALGVPGIEPNTNIDKLIGQLKKLLGTLKDSTVNDDKPIQSKLCNELAKSLNARYGKVIINLDDAPREICRKVKEVSHTLFAGLHNEFLAIASDVQTSMKNIGLLRQHLAAAFTKIMNSINESSDESLKMEAAQIQMYHKNIDEELSRQMAILTNIMSGVIDPVTGNLVALLEESDEFAGFVEKIKDDLGTDEFGKKLSQLLAGVNQVAQVAYVVDKALKKIGMSVKDYKNTKGIANLRLKIYDLLMAKGTKLRARDIQTFMQAAEIIYKNDYAHDDIVKYLEKKKGGHYGGNEIPSAIQDPYNMPTYDFGQDSLRTTGGVTERKKRSLEYRIEQQKKYRRLIFKDFEKRLQPEYNKIINAVHAIAPFIGNEIPVNDALLDFVKVFQNIQEVDQENFHVILTGYRRDAYSKDERNKFLETLNSISRIVSHLSSGPKGEQFRRIKSSIDNLVSIIDTFKDKFLKAITAVAIESKGVAEKGLIRSYGQYEQNETFDGGKKSDRVKKLKEHAKKKAREAAKKVQEDPRVQQSISQLQDVGMETAQKAVDVSAEAASGVVSQGLDRATEGLSQGIEMAPGISGRADNIEDIDTEFPSPLENEQINMYQGMQSSGLVSGISATSPETPDEELMTHDVMASSLSHTYPEYVGHGEYSGGDDYSSGVDGYSTITRASRDLQYYIHIAQIRGNLKSLPQELADFDENYTTILGNAAAGMLEKTRKDYEKMNNSIGSGVGETEMGERVRPINVDIGLYNAFKHLTGLGNADEAKRWREIKANSLKFSKMKYEAQKDLIEVAQAIDLYMKAFARAIAERPDTIKNLNSMLDSVKIVAKFFSETSGNFVAKLYEELPNGYRATDTPEHKDAEIYSTMADNVQNANVSGWKLKLKDSQHYYERLVQILNINDDKTPGHPFKAFLLTNNKFKSMSDSTKSVLKSFRVLDNIISTFTRLGDSVINTKASSQTFMSAGQMFNKLINYMTWATWTQGYKDGDDMNADSEGYTRADAHEANHLMSGPWHTHIGAGDIAEISSIPPAAGATVVKYAKYVRQQCGISMNSISNLAAANSGPYDKQQRSVAGYKAYQDTDRLFEQCIKALVVKPFITLSLYRIFHHPSTMDHPLRPIRTILGGGRGGAMTKIKPEALEVYIRLPLMAEWYRGVFKFQKIDNYEDPARGIPENERSIFDREEDTEDGGSGLRKISMVPEIDMVWSDIIRLIFDEAKYVNHGTYSDAQVDKIIAEVNAIYDRFKSANPKNPVGAILVAFRDEINRRYGIVKQEEINKYFEERDKRWEDYDAKELSERDRVDQFDILDAEDQVEMGTRPAPSEKFMTVGAVLRGKRKDQFTWKFKEILDNFRNTIDENLAETDPITIRTSFYQTLRQHKHDLARASSEEDKYKIVRRAIQGVDKLAGIHNNKLLIFHEMVSVPLQTLYHLYCSVKYYNDTINMFDPDVLKKAIESASNTGPNRTFIEIRWNGANAGVGGGNRGSFQTVLDTIDAYKSKFTDGPSFAKHYFKSVLSQTTPELAQLVERSVTLANVNGVGAAGTFPSQNQFEGNGNNEKRFAALAFKYGLDWHKIFRTVSQLVWGMGDSLNQLVDVRQDGHKILVDYSRLQETVELLLNNIRKTVNKFRGVLPQDILHRFEKGRTVGSIYWLEENFVEILLKNRDDDGLPRTNEIVNGVYKYIINSKKTDSPLYSKIVPDALNATQNEFFDEASALAVVDPAGFGGSDLSMEREFAKMIYWDTLQPNLFSDGPNKFVEWNGMNNYPFNLLPLFELDKEPVDAKEKEEAVIFKKFLEEAARKHAELAHARATQNLLPIREIISIDETLLNASRAMRRAQANQNYTYAAIRQDAAALTYTGIGWTAAVTRRLFRTRINNARTRLNKIKASPSPIAEIQADLAIIVTRFEQIFDVLTNVNNVRPATRTRFHTDARWNALVSAADPALNNPRANAKFHLEAATAKATNAIRVAEASVNAIMVGKEELLAKFDFPYFKRANWYNVSSNNFSLDRPGRKRKFFNLEQKNEYYRDEFHTVAGASTSYTDTYDAWTSPYKGLVVRFNETLAKFISTFYDSTAKKLYLPLIETFATGNQNRAVMHGDALNDLIFVTDNRTNLATPVDNWYADDTFRIGDPPPGVILFASIARTLKTLIQTIDKTTKQSKHTVTSLSELPNHLIESMRCNLPIFIKLFELHIQRAEFIKKLLAMDFPTHRTVYKHHVMTNSNLQDENGAALPVVAGAAARTVKHRGNFPYDDEKNNYNKYNRPGNKLFVRYDAYDAGVVAANIIAPQGAKVEKASYFKRYLDSIISACQAIQKNAKKVYRELEDAPLYLELEADSISNYVQRYNRSPIMPHSTMSWVMRPVADMDLTSDDVAEQGSVLMPGFTVGQDQFKFNYGTRGVLQRWDVKPALDYFPGMKLILSGYNGVADVGAQMDAGHFVQMVEKNTILTRYISDNKLYKKMLGGHILYSAPISWNPEVAGAGAIPGMWGRNALIQAESPDPTASCDAGNNVVNGKSICKELVPLALAYFNNIPAPGPYEQNKVQLSDLIAITENSFVEENIKKMVILLKPEEPEMDTRAIIRKINIIDMNIVPINVHALQREIPFINLFNYSYTFDRMIFDILVPQTGIYANNKIPNKSQADAWRPRTTSEALAKLCIHPYSKLNQTEYYGWLRRLVTGDSGLDLGRPKFLGDQLWNKALFQELYAIPGEWGAVPALGPRPPHPHFPDEGGPSVDSVAFRSQGNINVRGAPLADRYFPAGNTRITFPPAITDKPWSRKQMRKETSLASAYVEEKDPLVRDRTVDAHSSAATKRSMVGQVDFTGLNAADNRTKADEIGRLRFDTTLMRTMWLLTSIQRVQRMVFRDELNYIESPIAVKAKVLSKSVTEYGPTEKWSRAEDTDPVTMF